MNKNVLIIASFLLALGACFFVSCNKDVDENILLQPDMNVLSTEAKDAATFTMPYYANMKMVWMELQNMKSLSTTEEYMSYESNRGYYSIGTMADLVCDTLNFDECKNMSDFQFLYASNCRYLDTTKINGETFVDSKFSNNVFRHIADTNGYFRVGDTVIRIFKNATLATNIENINSLINLDENNPTDNMSGSIVQLSGLGGSWGMGNSISCWDSCGTSFEQSNIQGEASNGSTWGSRRLSVSSEWINWLVPSREYLCDQRYIHRIVLKVHEKRIVWIPIKSHITYSYSIKYHWASHNSATNEIVWNEECASKSNTTEYKRTVEVFPFDRFVCCFGGTVRLHCASTYLRASAPHIGTFTTNQ